MALRVRRPDLREKFLHRICMSSQCRRCPDRRYILGLHRLLRSGDERLLLRLSMRLASLRH